MSYINLIIVFAFIFLFIISRNYKKELLQELDGKEYPLKFLFPLGMFLMDKTAFLKQKGKGAGPSNIEEPLKALHVGEELKQIKKLYLCNKLVTIISVIVLTNLFTFISSKNQNERGSILDGKYLKRPGIAQGNKSIDVHVKVSGKGDSVLDEDMKLEIEEKQYDLKDLQKAFKKGKEYIDSKILNGNEAADEVRNDLAFAATIPDTGISVEWMTDSPELIDSKGRVYNESLKEGVLTQVTAVLTYRDRKEAYIRNFKVLPKVYSAQEEIKRKLNNVIEEINENSITQDRITLPETIEGKKITWSEEKYNSSLVIFIFGSLIAVLIYVVMDKELYSKVEKRNMEMLLDYPEIVNKFTLLVGAGMSLSNAWCKISRDYKEKGGKKRYAYEEMVITYGELMLGTSEMTAYERFGRRVKLLPYLRFSTLLAQNVKKGSAGLLNQLELEAAEAFQERKELAKRQGEEAGTKLLMPMMLMLILVLAIIMVPAFLSF